MKLRGSTLLAVTSVYFLVTAWAVAQPTHVKSKGSRAVVLADETNDCGFISLEINATDGSISEGPGKPVVNSGAFATFTHVDNCANTIISASGFTALPDYAFIVRPNMSSAQLVTDLQLLDFTHAPPVPLTLNVNLTWTKTADSFSSSQQFRRRTYGPSTLEITNSNMTSETPAAVIGTVITPAKTIQTFSFATLSEEKFGSLVLSKQSNRTSPTRLREPTTIPSKGSYVGLITYFHQQGECLNTLVSLFADTGVLAEGIPGMMVVTLQQTDRCAGAILYSKFMVVELPAGAFSINKNLSAARLTYSDPVEGISMNYSWTATGSGEKSTNRTTFESAEGTMMGRFIGTIANATVTGSITIPGLGNIPANNDSDARYSLIATLNGTKSIAKRQ